RRRGAGQLLGGLGLLDARGLVSGGALDRARPARLRAARPAGRPARHAGIPRGVGRAPLARHLERPQRDERLRVHVDLAGVRGRLHRDGEVEVGGRVLDAGVADSPTTWPARTRCPLRKSRGMAARWKYRVKTVPSRCDRRTYRPPRPSLTRLTRSTTPSCTA